MTAKLSRNRGLVLRILSIGGSCKIESIRERVVSALSSVYEMPGLTDLGRRRAAEREPTRDKHTDLDMGSSAVVRFGSRDNWNHIGTASPINSSTQKTQDDLAEGDDAFVRAMLLKRNNGVVPRSIDTNMMPQITSCVADAQRVWHYGTCALRSWWRHP